MKKSHVILLLAITWVCTNPCHAQQNSVEPTSVQLRVIQTRTFKTDDFDAAVNALNDAMRALNFRGESKIIKELNKQMTSFSCTPYVKNDVATIGSLSFVYLYCSMRRLDNGNGISVRLSLQGMTLNMGTHAYTKLRVDVQAYQKIFDKMGEAMFINAQKIEPAELQ